MWSRNNVIVAALVAAFAISWAGPAAAQGTGAPVVTPPAVPALAAGKVFAPPAVLVETPRPAVVIGEEWARAVRAVVDGVKHLVDAEKVEAAQALRPKGVTAPGAPAPPVVPAWQVSWTPAGAFRDAVGKAPVQVGPTVVAPPTESPRDARGEHAVLLGAKVELPWRVP